MGLETRRRNLGFDTTLPLSVFWKQGVKGFLDHLDSSANPYNNPKTSRARGLWFDGYYDARRILKWGVAADADEEEKAEYIQRMMKERNEP